MGFYDLSYVTFAYAKIDHDVKSVVVVHRSSFVPDQFCVSYNWKGEVNDNV